jgi:DNA-binding response OmpR family regulator
VAREAQRLRPSLKVLLTSGYAEEILAKSGAKSGDLIPKPYTPRELVQRISILLKETIDEHAHLSSVNPTTIRETAHLS